MLFVTSSLTTSSKIGYAVGVQPNTACLRDRESSSLGQALSGDAHRR